MSDVTLNLTFAERSVLNISLGYYKPVTADDRAAWESLKRKVAQTKCSPSSCSICDPNYDYSSYDFDPYD